jgi:hypothetical protein
MVTIQAIMTGISQGATQSSSTVTSDLEQTKRDSIATTVSFAPGFSPSTTAQSKYSPVAPSKVLLFSSPSITGAQVTPDLGTDANEMGVIVLRSGIFSAADFARPIRRVLAQLPKVKISTQFEPHLRQSSVNRLKTLMTEFQHSIGQPEVAVVREELRDALLETYKQAVAVPETRSFASAVSMIQGFLRPHWSNLPQNQIVGITETLTWLDSQRDLSAATLTKFYRELATVVGSRISPEAPAIEENDEDEEGNDE